MVYEDSMLAEWKLQMTTSRIFFDYLRDTKAIPAMTESILKAISEETLDCLTPGNIPKYQECRMEMNELCRKLYPEIVSIQS